MRQLAKKYRGVKVNRVQTMARVIIGISALLATAHAAGLHYKPHGPVFVVANKVGPFNNPSETYEVSSATPPRGAPRASSPLSYTARGCALGDCSSASTPRGYL